MTTTRTLRDYLSSLPEGIGASVVTPGLQSMPTANFVTADMLAPVAAVAASALQEIQPGNGVEVDNTDPQRPIVTATGATQVNADWDATSGPAEILNKPTLGTAAAQDVEYFATAAQGEAAETALQPEAIGVSVQAYSSVLQNTTASFTSALLAKLNGIASGATANQSDAYLLNRANHTGTQAAGTITGLAAVATTGAYSDLSDKPTLGAMAAKNNVAVSDISATGTPDNTTYLRGDGSWSTPAGGGGSGTVTSVAATVPTGLSVSGSPITISGTLAFTWASGYQAYTSVEATKLSGITAGADPTGTTMAAATAKTTPVDADTLAINDSAASNALKKVTWANVKATLKTYFDTLYQPLAAKLTALAGQTWAADQITYQTSSSAVSTTTLTSFGRSLIDDADASAARSTLGLVIGTNVQAQSAKLSDIAGLSPTTGDSIVWNGTNYVSQAAGGGTVIQSIQTGYASTTSASSGSGEDGRYLDVTISSVTTTKCMVLIYGLGGSSSGSAITSGSSNVVSARLTSPTNLRLSTPGGAFSNIYARWTVVEYK